MPRDANRTSLIGSRASGKTTVAGLLALCAQELSSRRRDQKTEVREATFNVRGIVANLLAGNYPPATETAQSYMAELRLRFRRKYSPIPTTVSISLTDVAGETLREVLDRFENQRFDLDEATLARVRDVNRHILNASSFMLVVDLERLLFEDEMTRQDEQLARFADTLLKFKANRQQSPQVKAIALILTKHDRVEDLLGVRDSLSLQEEEGRRAFLEKYMIQTHSALGNLPNGTVEMFYSSCEPELDASGQPTGKIMKNAETNRPVYSIDEYERLLDWIQRRLA